MGEGRPHVKGHSQQYHHVQRRTLQRTEYSVTNVTAHARVHMLFVADCMHPCSRVLDGGRIVESVMQYSP